MKPRKDRRSCPKIWRRAAKILHPNFPRRSLSCNNELNQAKFTMPTIVLLIALISSVAGTHVESFNSSQSEMSTTTTTTTTMSQQTAENTKLSTTEKQHQQPLIESEADDQFILIENNLLFQLNNSSSSDHSNEASDKFASGVQIEATQNEIKITTSSPLQQQQQPPVVSSGAQGDGVAATQLSGNGTTLTNTNSNSIIINNANARQSQQQLISSMPFNRLISQLRTLDLSGKLVQPNSSSSAQMANGGGGSGKLESPSEIDNLAAVGGSGGHMSGSGDGNTNNINSNNWLESESLMDNLEKILLEIDKDKSQSLILSHNEMQFEFWSELYGLLAAPLRRHLIYLDLSHNSLSKLGITFTGYIEHHLAVHASWPFSSGSNSGNSQASNGLSSFGFGPIYAAQQYNLHSNNNGSSHQNAANHQQQTQTLQANQNAPISLHNSTSTNSTPTSISTSEIHTSLLSLPRPPRPQFLGETMGAPSGIGGGPTGSGNPANPFLSQSIKSSASKMFLQTANRITYSRHSSSLLSSGKLFTMMQQKLAAAGSPLALSTALATDGNTSTAAAAAITTATSVNILHQMTLLKALDLSHNKLKWLINDQFKALKHVQIIRLNNNRLRYIHQHAFSGLESLRYLNLDFNRLQVIYVEQFQTNYNLLSLTLRSNNLAYLRAGSLASLSKLKLLDLSQNKFTILGNNAFLGLESLQQLNLSSNQMVHSPSASLRPLTNLERLDLSANQLSQLTPGSFFHLPLRELSLGQNELLVSIDRGAFWDLPHLKKLNLSSNSMLMDINPQAFVGVPNLQVILAEDCQSLDGSAKQMLENITRAATSRQLRLLEQQQQQMLSNSTGSLTHSITTNGNSTNLPVQVQLANGTLVSQQQQQQSESAQVNSSQLLSQMLSTSGDSETLAGGLSKGFMRQSEKQIKYFYYLGTISVLVVALKLVFKYTSTSHYLERRRQRRRIYEAKLGVGDQDDGSGESSRGGGGSSGSGDSAGSLSFSGCGARSLSELDDLMASDGANDNDDSSPLNHQLQISSITGDPLVAYRMCETKPPSPLMSSLCPLAGDGVEVGAGSGAFQPSSEEIAPVEALIQMPMLLAQQQQHQPPPRSASATLPPMTRRSEGDIYQQNQTELVLPHVGHLFNTSLTSQSLSQLDRLAAQYALIEQQQQQQQQQEQQQQHLQQIQQQDYVINFQDPNGAVQQQQQQTSCSCPDCPQMMYTPSEMCYDPASMAQPQSSSIEQPTGSATVQTQTSHLLAGVDGGVPLDQTSVLNEPHQRQPDASITITNQHQQQQQQQQQQQVAPAANSYDLFQSQLLEAGLDHYDHVNCAHFYQSLGPALKLAHMSANFHGYY